MKKTRSDRWSVLLVALLGSGAGCNNGSESASLPNVGVDAGTGDAATGPLTDPQILGVIMAADDGEIAQAQLARNRGHDTGVLLFADRMIVEHGGTDTQITQLEQTLGAAQPSPVSAQVAAQSQQIALQLTATIPPADFDLDYMNAQVQVHTDLLALLDTQLIPQAQSADLQAFLVNAVRPATVAHLRTAKTIVRILGRLGTVVTDAQGAALFGAPNQGLILRGQQAQTAATAPAVIQFATREVTDHTAMAQQLAQLDLGTANDSFFSALLAEGVQFTNQVLAQAAPGAQFDHVYMEGQIALHLIELMLIDDFLIPSAQAPEWKSFLETVRPTYRDHLASAEQIVVSLPFAP